MNRFRITVPGADPALLNYETAKEKLFVKLCCPETSRDFLRLVPHTRIQDMEATYHLMLPSGKDGIASVMVDHELFGRFNIGLEQLHKDAMENTPRLLPPMAFAMTDMLFGTAQMPQVTSANWREGFREQLQELSFRDTNMIVISNNKMMGGASCICDQEIMRMVADQMKENFFILPSSVHEVILVPDNGTLQPAALEDMIVTVNNFEVAPQDKLSDTLYHYDVKDNLLERASVFERRMQEKAMERSAERPVPAKNVTIERESIKVRLESAAKESAAQPLKKAPGKEQLLN